MLTNTRSDRVRSVRALSRRSARERTGRFVADGPQSVREAVRWAAGDIDDLYLTTEAGDRFGDIVEAAANAGVRCHEVSAEVLDAMSETDAPQGLLAVCRVPRLGADPLGDLLATGPRRLVLLASVRDPGNAGTVVRAADAFGADAVLLGEGSVDVHSAKVVRSTAGSLFHLPVLAGLTLEATIRRLRAHGIRTLAADGAGSVELPEADLRGAHAWVLGNEAWGLPEPVRAECDEVVRVPIRDRVESLNLAMCATVCLYASASAAAPGARASDPRH